MILLIHGTDLYLSYKELERYKKEALSKNNDIKSINVDSEDEVTDPSVIYSALSEQDLFGNKKLIILKRITSSDYFYKLGKPLKTSSKLFDELKKSLHNVILWEDKKLTEANPLTKLAQKKVIFDSPIKDYEMPQYIQKNFPDVSIDLKKIISTSIKTTNTLEVSSEIEKLKFMPKDQLKLENLSLSSTSPSWIIGDHIMQYLQNASEQNYLKMENIINSFDEDLRYKIAIIQNTISDLIYIKRSKTDERIKDIFFGSKRGFLVKKNMPIADKIHYKKLIELYKKTLIVEYLLNKGLILEKACISTIFLADFKSLYEELL